VTTPALRRGYERECRNCGRTFRPWSRLQPYCSRACSDVGRHKPRQLCPVCGTQRADSRYRKDRRYCSKACSDVGSRKPRGVCSVCRAEIPGRKTITCSARCGYVYRKLRTRAPRPCPVCRTLFAPTPSALARGAGKYCSKECYVSVQSKRPRLLETTCTNCGSTFKRTAAALKRVKSSFCSESCMASYRVGDQHPAWRGGHDPNRGPGWIALAERMRARDGRLCRWCGKTEAANGQRLSVDHIIPWRSFASATEANDPANLASLCRSCHAKKARAENRWLRGDVLDMWRYQVAVSQPWKAA
jgi:hypothetical protein